MRDSKKDNFINPKYKTLSPTQSEFLNSILEMQRELDKNRPHAKIKTKVPSVLKGDNEKGLDLKESPSVSSLKEYYDINFKLNDAEKVARFGDNSLRENRKIILNYTGDIPIDKQSKNIIKNTLAIAKDTFNYIEMEKILPKAQAIESVISNPEHMIIQEDTILTKIGEVLPNGMRTTLKSKITRGKISPETSNRLEQVKSIIDFFFYGVNEKELNYFGANINKIVDRTMSFASLKALGFNFFADVVNLSNATYQKWLNDTGKSLGYEFSEFNQLKASSKLKNFVSDFYSDIDKYGNKSFIGQLLDEFNVFFDDELGTLGEDTLDNGVSKVLSRRYPMVTKSLVEFHNASHLFFTLAEKLKFTRLDDNKTYTADEVFELKDGELKVKSGYYYNGEELTEDTRSKIVNDISSKYQSLKIRLDGNYAKQDMTMLGMTAGGKILEFMKKFFVPLMAERYKTKGYYIENDEIREGFYVTAIKRLWLDISTGYYNIYTNWSTYSEEEKIASLKVLKELLTYALIGLMLGLLGYDDDDDKERSTVVNYLIYYNLKLQNEIALMAFPKVITEIPKQILDTPIIFNSITQTGRLINDMKNFALGDEKAYYTKDSDLFFKTKGDLKFLYDVFNYTPIPRINKMFYPEEMIKSMEYAKLR